MAQTVKHLSTMWETWVRSLGWEDPLEKEMARNPTKTVGVARGHQRANTLKPYSQKTSQSNHTRTTALSNSMKLSHAHGAIQDGWVMVDRGLKKIFFN